MSNRQVIINGVRTVTIEGFVLPNDSSIMRIFIKTDYDSHTYTLRKKFIEFDDNIFKDINISNLTNNMYIGRITYEEQKAGKIQEFGFFADRDDPMTVVVYDDKFVISNRQA